MGRHPLEPTPEVEPTPDPPTEEGHYPKMGGGTTVGDIKMAPAFERILTTMFRCDPWSEYTALEDALHISSGKFTDHDTLMSACNTAEDNARKAHRLYCAARVEKERFELDAKEIEGAARRSVVRDMNLEKEGGQRKKQITEADIEAEMFDCFPDEYKRLQDSRLRYRKMVEHLERLADLWVSRCRTLQSMLGKVR